MDEEERNNDVEFLEYSKEECFILLSEAMNRIFDNMELVKALIKRLAHGK